ncbi:MAG: chemotaxis protein A [Melioribacteraceae bacterium]|nr:MAG: chemotaxis protein A [Melioribacteraceae bacterium]
MDENNNYMMLADPEMKEIVDSFIVETKEILEQLDTDLVLLEESPRDSELLNKIFRAFHTIKGTSGFLGLVKLPKVTHKCEDILNKLKKGEAEVDSILMDGILDSFDTIKELVEYIETKNNEDVEVEETIKHLTMLLDRIENPDKYNDAEFNSEDSDEEPAEVVAEDDLSDEEFDKLIQESFNKQNRENKEIEKKETPVIKEKAETQPAKSKNVEVKANTPVKKADDSIRVDVERLDELLNIVSELVLGRNQLAQLNNEFGLEFEGTKYARDLSEASRQIDLMTNELQLVVMKTRMVKIGKVFNRFPRLVRDLARETKKNIRLVIKGEETELDKTLVEEIYDPLVHLVRNSADHGLENEEDRTKEGKNPQGVITLNAQHESNNIIITVEDNGRGIDPDKILNKAISKGLITEEQAKEFSKQDIFNLIFVPGFSTAEQVSNVSGRGVGMDVVKTNVLKLRGMINIDSEVGVGTRIKIVLPLTLAIIHGMIVKVSTELAVIPLNSVLEVVSASDSEIYTINQKEVIHLRDMTIPLLSIEDILRTSSNGKEKEKQYIVIVKIGEKTFGIKVDELIGQQEVVIKSLGNYLGDIKGVAGSTIMGDGTVVMILDLSEIISKLEKKVARTN